MLFSDKKIAKYINENFEPIWVKVAPVPTVTIDFGNGKKIKRTVTGNIATYVCTTDGYIVDILPGIYKPKKYLSSLVTLNKTTRKFDHANDSLSTKLSEYHLSELKKANFQTNKSKGNSKIMDYFLGADTQTNEKLRRKMIHQILSDGQLQGPGMLHPRIYKEVLGLDLKDPYMGLKAMLDRNYPFRSN